MSADTEPRDGRAEPLWDRVDRNRAKIAVFVTLFVIGVALSAAVLTLVAGFFVWIVAIRAGYIDWFLSAFPKAVLMALAIGAFFGIVHVVRALIQPGKRLPKRFGARLSDTGTLLPQKSALHDMALAAGFRHAPPLWIIDDCDRVNAFAVGLSEGAAIVGITQGFVDRLTTDSQRAVFANLMARLKTGDTMSATAISAIMGPIWDARAREFRQQDEPDTAVATATSSTGQYAAASRSEAFVVTLVVGFVAVVLTELLMAGHERAAHVASEKADAEGMLLLKDPEAMVVALREVLEMNNTVIGAGEAYSMLFYCWAGFGYAPEDDPEMRRIGRLREILGAGGV